MPQNNNLEPATLPMEIKFGQQPTTRFLNNLASIKVELLQAPSMDDLRSYLPQFAEATWSPRPDTYDNLVLRDKDKIIKDVFFGRTLPTALETVRLNFRLSGISLQEVTHILRYRTAAFSADCSGDKWWTDKDALVPNSVLNSPELYGRYREVVNAAKQLYVDMIDTKDISIMDARYILPRCLSTFYYMSISLKDAIHFIRQRMDKQIQPETDNMIAYLMYLEVLKQYPVANGLIDIHAPSQFYINTARTGKATNLYFPDKDSDKFEWNEDDFIYQAARGDVCGTTVWATSLFDRVLLPQIEDAIRTQEELNNESLEAEYSEHNEEEPLCDGHDY